MRLFKKLRLDEKNDGVIIQWGDFSCELDFCMVESGNIFSFVGEKIRERMPVFLFVDFLAALDDVTVFKRFVDEKSRGKKFFPYAEGEYDLGFIPGTIPYLLMRYGGRAVPFFGWMRRDGVLEIHVGKAVGCTSTNVSEEGTRIARHIFEFWLPIIREDPWGWTDMVTFCRYMAIADRRKLTPLPEGKVLYEDGRYTVATDITFVKRGRTLYLVSVFPFMIVKTEDSVREIVHSLQRYHRVPPRLCRKLSSQRINHILRLLLETKLLKEEIQQQ